MSSDSPAHAEGERHDDSGVRWSSSAPGDPADVLPLALTIDAFAGSASSPVRWADSRMPIEFCTHDANRPAGVSRALLIEAVEDSMAMWNSAGAAIGLRYVGACTSGSRWAPDNGVNEIAFDDQRNVVSAPAVAATRGTWLFGRFTEMDIVINPDLLDIPEACFRSMIAHELGHALGMGHSDTRGDLMYPSFDAGQVASCPQTASAEEFAWLVDVYGTNTPPAIAEPLLSAVPAGRTSTLSVSAHHAGGSPLEYEWTQVSGPPVDFTPTGASIMFVAPDEVGSLLQFHVEVTDRYMASTATTLTVETTEAPVSDFTGQLPPPGGVGSVLWQGGPVEAMIFAAEDRGCLLTSVWVTSGGRLVGYVAGSPAFVNSEWLALYPADVPPGTPVLALCG